MPCSGFEPRASRTPDRWRTNPLRYGRLAHFLNDIFEALPSLFKKPESLSTDEALAMIADTNVSNSDYKRIRQRVKKVNCKCFPSCCKVNESKLLCCPAVIVITERSSEISLQSLIGQGRLHLLETAALSIIIKWRCGRVERSKYSQMFSEENLTDENLFSIYMVPLQTNSGTEEPKTILWQNPASQSTIHIYQGIMQGKFKRSEFCLRLICRNSKLVTLIMVLGEGNYLETLKSLTPIPSRREKYTPKSTVGFRMPVSHHKILFHGRDIITSCILPICQYSEEAQESRNKHKRQYGALFTRKTSRTYTSTDLLHILLLITSDPVIYCLLATPKTKRRLMDPAVLNLLESADDTDSAAIQRQ
ncbi:hypothetical protein PR048_006753 [Dryococelus australis]|uniref:Uncharacterized protein n=1 Tax=Dryococelus australis TaxID=614101 RepID=A0ABQ9IE12_9NEOP|nr:hypothetical protein PR048_006753 [Dryococelus australis]